MGWGFKRKHKYGAVATHVDGIRFASKAEARRYSQLKLLEQGGEIRGLRIQPRFPLEIDGALVCTYIGDFAYREKGTPYEVVEDVKSPATRTDVYKLKVKILLATYRDIEFREVR
jgi:hypothetical protein